MPYAVGLSLTVAYRGLRDNAKVDAERAQADLATRCEILEKLSTYWWTADAMARLGRKALKSLQQPGVRKHSVANLVNAMDAEVAVCKFGPFERQGGGGSHRPSSSNGPNATRSGGTTGNDVTPGNALHVLSDAAATHSTAKNGSTINAGMNNEGQSSTITPTPSFSTGTTPHRTGQSHGNDASPPTTATSTNLAPTPSTVLEPSASSAAHTMTSAGAGAGLPGSAVSPPFGTATTAGMYDTQFNDLDNLFDGFFDLSMPTIFQDPLFDGDAFLNADLQFDDDPNMMAIDAGGGFGSSDAVTMANMGMNMSPNLNPNVGAHVGGGGGGGGGSGKPSSSTSNPGGAHASAYPDISLR